MGLTKVSAGGVLAVGSAIIVGHDLKSRNTCTVSVIVVSNRFWCGSTLSNIQIMQPRHDRTSPRMYINIEIFGTIPRNSLLY